MAILLPLMSVPKWFYLSCFLLPSDGIGIRSNREKIKDLGFRNFRVFLNVSRKLNRLSWSKIALNRIPIWFKGIIIIISCNWYKVQKRDSHKLMSLLYLNYLFANFILSSRSILMTSGGVSGVYFHPLLIKNKVVFAFLFNSFMSFEWLSTKCRSVS